MKGIFLCCVLISLIVMCVNGQQACSAESKQMASLLANITSQLRHSGGIDQANVNEFTHHTTHSLTMLNDQLQRTQTELMTQKTAHSSHRIQLIDSQTQHTKLQASIAEIQAAADNTQIECSRSERLYDSRQKEHSEALHLISMITSLMQSDTQQDNQLLVSNLLSVLPSLTSRDAAPTTRVDIVGNVQNLLDTSSDNDDEMTRQKLITLLKELKEDTQAALEEEKSKFEQESRRCSGDMNSLRERLTGVENMNREITEKVAVLSKQVSVEAEQIELLETDVSVLSFALKNKHTIQNQIDNSFAYRRNVTDSSHHTLHLLETTPLCCVC